MLGDFDRFSVERLFAFLNRLNREVEIRITPAADRAGHQRVVEKALAAEARKLGLTPEQLVLDRLREQFLSNLYEIT